jgi:hypothetical protein
LAVILLFAAGSVLYARPAHKQALVDYFGPFLPKHLNDCRTCHLPDAPGQEESGTASAKPHNPFGARLKAVKSELRKAGKQITIAARLEAVADEDSDGDGVSNLLELLSGHFPGDPKDTPTPHEIAKARQKLLAFREYKNRYHWTPFEKVKRPSVPVVKNAAWVRNPIDAFIAAEHERRGLIPRPEAPKSVLLRRVYLDLIGLPPTPEELHAFLADESPQAYAKVVDHLLESPQYGERWGRHWMDIWRYSDWAGWTDGGQIRDSQPHIWRWRDWIVESLNQDKGYDRMILEMLAADELAPEDPKALRATGYLVRNYKMLSREKWMQDTVDHTFLAYQGVTLGCARCHDHMYDPILQKEYYQVRAIFEPHNVRIDRIPGQPDTAKDGLVRVYDAAPQVPTFLFIRGDDRNPDKSPLPPQVPEMLGGKFLAAGDVKLPPDAYAPDHRGFVIQEDLEAARAKVGQLRNAWNAAAQPMRVTAASLLRQPVFSAAARLVAERTDLERLALAQLEKDLAEAQLTALAAVIEAERLEDAGRKDSPEWKRAAGAAVAAQRKLAVVQARRNLLLARQAKAAGAAKPKAAPTQKLPEARAALAKAEAEAGSPASTAYVHRSSTTYPAVSTGRRLAFARWLASQDNPVTARVAMNHVWLRHFGQAIVPSVFDFGRNGRPPSHPALLDWLAAEFMDPSRQPLSPEGREAGARGWSMKTMHRLIVTSATYRMASTTDAANVAIDRDNQFLWHMPSRRMEAEVVRDCIFFVAGKLDPTMGGPEIDYHQGLTTPRRSLYFRHAAEKEMEFLKLFDCAAVTECYQRKESIMPQQALALANSEVTLVHARLVARQLADRIGSDNLAFTTAAFERVLSRPPTDQELAECAGFLGRQAQRYQQTRHDAPRGNQDAKVPATDPALRARESLVHVLMNHNDFVTVR